MDFRGAFFCRVKDFGNQGKRQLWILDFDRLWDIQTCAFRDNYTRRLGCPGQVKEFCVCDVGDLSVTRGIEVGDSLDHDTAVTKQTAANVRGEFSDRFLDPGHNCEPPICRRPDSTTRSLGWRTG